MQIAHLADAHLGFRQYHRQTPHGLNQREADIGNAFRHTLDGIIAAAPAAVLIAGDLFHSVRPSNPAILFAFHQLQRLREALPTAPIVLIAGNHDTPRSSETGSILRLFESLGVHVVAEEARRLVFPELDLSILAVPDQALRAVPRPLMLPEGNERHQVLLLHSEVEGVFPFDRTSVEYGGVVIGPGELTQGKWSYVALGHYHVPTRVAPRIWYAGALEYTSSNPWGELAEERKHGIEGKGWLLADLETGEAAFQRVPPARRVMDLEPIEGAGLTAEEIDRQIAARVAAIEGGLADQIARLLVWNVPRHVGRELDHAAVRAWKSQALHFHLDLRRPESARETGVGSPGRRQTLPELTAEYLRRRPLPGQMDRERFVQIGTGLLDQVEREASER